jgi:hypothetical protein
MSVYGSSRLTGAMMRAVDQGRTLSPESQCAVESGNAAALVPRFAA